MLIAPTVRRPEFLSLNLRETLEYKAWDLPTVTLTTVLEKKMVIQNKINILILLLIWCNSFKQNNHCPANLSRDGAFKAGGPTFLPASDTGMQTCDLSLEFEATQRGQQPCPMNPSHAKDYESCALTSQNTWHE